MSTLGSFIWSIADQLRGPYRPNQYGNVILPLTILRRLDCILEPDRETMRELAAKYDNPNRLRVEVKKATGRSFYNTSNYSFANLLADADGLVDNLNDYIDRFSPDVDVFEYFDFKKEILALEKAELLREVVKAFGAVDLHPNVVSNSDMGDAFEYIIRKFNEAANETSGDHYTPRDAIRLLVDLLFAEEDAGLSEEGIIRTLYDPTAGTGGMLSLAEEHLLAQNPDARLSLYGQEYNPQSYAICKSDMIAKGNDATNIAFGNTLTDDAFKGRQFDFCMSNPPYGVDWKQYVKQVTKERDESGPYGRFAPGLPATSDGQMLFLLHLAHKMRAPEDGGGRVGIVMNGSPLFNGGAESGPSSIRRWLLENDLVEAIVALPTNMFFNTGIATYIWILDNTKSPDRKGLVQLIDGTSFWTKMRKSLGSKTREISDKDRAKVVKLYTDFLDADPNFSRVLRNDEFGYWTITVERPLLDDLGNPVVDRRGKQKPDAKKRDTENVPFTFQGSAVGDAGRSATTKEYYETEVLPYVPDAWIDSKKTKIGYEIPFARIFLRDPDSFHAEELTERFRADEEEAAALAAQVARFASEFARRARDEKWPIVPLRRVASVVNGGTPKADAENWDGPINWATPVDLNAADGFLSTTGRTLTELGLGSLRQVPAGSVLVSSRAPIGSVAITRVHAAFNQGCKGLIGDPTRVTSACLAFQLMSSKNLLESLGQGTTFLEINADKLASAPVLLPPLDVQSALAFDETIRAFHRARRLFESLTEQARVRRRGMDMLIARGAAVEVEH